MERLLAIPSPVGWWLLGSQEDQLLMLDYAGQAQPGGISAEPESKLEKRLDCMLSRYFRGECVDFSPVPVAFKGTAFQNAVWHNLRTVPYGEVRSYQWLAEISGYPKAMRAVGGAMGRNPLPIIVPCHRIVSKAGALGGFMRGNPCGPRLKSFLLTTEGVGFLKGLESGFGPDVLSGVP